MIHIVIVIHDSGNSRATFDALVLAYNYQTENDDEKPGELLSYSCSSDYENGQYDERRAHETEVVFSGRRG